MASINSNSLVRVNNQLTFKDFKHASALYVSDDMLLAPKVKFLYYAVFNINPALIPPDFKDKQTKELSYLVKQMDLPRYTTEATTLNQYNRKTNVYTKIAYDPVSLVFHDDNNGVTNALWAYYYGYYFADRNNGEEGDSAPAAYVRNTYERKNEFRYGLDNGSSSPFFTSIQLYVLTRGRYFGYTLCNPKITSWQHDTMDQSQGNGVVENKMTIAYDAVLYYQGEVKGYNSTGSDKLSGFADPKHYDKTPSVLSDYNDRDSSSSRLDPNDINSLSNPDLTNPPDAVTAINPADLVGRRTDPLDTIISIIRIANGAQRLINGIADITIGKDQSVATRTTEAVLVSISKPNDNRSVSDTRNNSIINEHSGRNDGIRDAYSKDFAEATKKTKDAVAFSKESTKFNHANKKVLDTSDGTFDWTSADSGGRVESSKSYRYQNSIMEQTQYLDNTAELLNNSSTADIPPDPFG